VSDPVRFYVDEHIPSAVVEGLRHRGVEVLTVNEAEMLGARDEEHLEFARKEDCVI
jgi:predicted nuclease of predicted toxin-antitoxin system